MNNANNGEPVKLLWTGGWDSTFRLVELSRQNVTVQPIYLFGDGRKSEKYERAAMSKIMELLKQKPGTKANILPLLSVNIADIELDAKISEAYGTIKEATGLGSQHEWIAWYAKANPGLEIGTEANPPENSRIITSIQQFAVLRETNGISRYYIDKDKSTREGALVLGNLTFPIVHVTELEMQESIREWGYEEVMRHIWFCHSPIAGKACGLCHPCEVKIDSGMGFLLGTKAVNRNRVKKAFYKLKLAKVHSILERGMRSFPEALKAESRKDKMTTQKTLTESE